MIAYECGHPRRILQGSTTRSRHPERHRLSRQRSRLLSIEVLEQRSLLTSSVLLSTSGGLPGLGADVSEQSFVAYLKLDGVIGESQDAAHQGWIDVLGFSQGASAAGTGTGGGKVSFSDFQIVKVLDKSSPVLFQDAASGKVITSGTLELVRPDGQVFMDYKLSNVLVTGVQDVGSGADGTTDEQVSLRFSKIEWDYTPYDVTGQAGRTVTGAWDLKTNQTGSGSTAPAVDVGNASGQAFVAYLKLDGVTGESQDVNHSGWIEVLAYSFGVSPASTATGSGGSGGKASFSDFRIIKVLDKSSPVLFQDAASGKVITSGTLELVRPDGQVFMDYKLSNVLVTGVQDLGSGANGTTDEQVSLRFSKIEWDYTPDDVTGLAGGTVTGVWDLKTNQTGSGSTAPAVDVGDASGQAFVAYLKLDGVTGESQDVNHSGWIEVLAYSFGVSPASTATGSGGSGGKASFSDFRIIKVLDKSSPVLFQDAASGKVITSGTLELVRPDGQVFMDYKLSNVFVTGVQDLGSGANGTTDEQVSLRFSKIEWDYTPEDVTGLAGGTVTGVWDLKTNQTGSGSTAPAVDVGNASGQAFVAYLKLDGVTGESQDVNHSGWIEVLAYSFGISPASTATGSGGSGGKASFSDFQIVKVLDKSSPVLFQDAASGKVITSGTLELVRPDGQVFMDYKLSNVFVTGVQDLGSGANGTADEQVSLRFSKIEWDYTSYDVTGQAGGTVTGAWDLKTNQTGSGSTAPAVDVGNASGQAFVAYLKLDGVTGESQDVNHSGWIEVLAYSFGVSPASTATGSGGSGGKASFSDFRIIKVLDKSSPVLFQDAASGKVITSGTLELVRPDGQVFMDYKLSNVFVTGVQDLGSGDNGTTDEQVSLRFSKIEWDYTPYDVTGPAGGTVSGVWDLKTNQTGSGSTAPAVDVGNASGQAFVAYLKLGGVTGESQDVNHSGWIEVLAYSFGVSPAVDGHG